MYTPEQITGQRGFYISATKKSSGKTVISLGLGAALYQAGFKVQPFKKGPDYIDPMWHQAATSRPCPNLDFFTQSKQEINQTYDRYRGNSDIVYIEGNKGLFDGVDTHGSDSNAALAEMLGLPVVLIVNTQGVTRGIAPLLSGYENFEEGTQFAGVILNEVAGPRHEAKLLAAVKEYTSLRVLGVVPRMSSLYLEERHLGLIPENEAQHATSYIDQVSRLVREHVDIDGIIDTSKTLAEPDIASVESLSGKTVKTRLRIGIARDEAFGFYYPDDLQAMQELGAELSFFDCLNDAHLPEVDALFIGGGFPETHLQALQGNESMRREIRQFIEADKPVYAECGGLMYLCRDISYREECAEMVGVIDARVKMTEKPIGRGYAKIKATQDHLWGRARLGDSQQHCHEFHYSRLEEWQAKRPMAYEITRGYGINGQADGIMVKNTLASYCHQRHTENNPWVKHFINFILEQKRD